MDQIKPNYNMNDLMDECISRFSDTFLLLKDTPEFIPTFVLDKLIAGISKELQRTWKRLRKLDKRFQKSQIDKKGLFRLFGQPRPMTQSESSAQETLPAEALNKEVQANVEEA